MKMLADGMCPYHCFARALNIESHSNMAVLQKVDFAKKIRMRRIKIAQDEGEAEEAERRGGTNGTGTESYPGTDNLRLFSKLLAADYGIDAPIDYVSVDATDVPMQY